MRQVQAHRAMRTPAVLAPAALALATLGRAAGWLAHGRARLPRITKAQRAHTRCMNTSSTNHKTHMLAATMAQACISVRQARPHCRRTRDAMHSGPVANARSTSTTAHAHIGRCTPASTQVTGWMAAGNATAAAASAATTVHACGPAALGTARQGALALGTAGWPPLGPRLARLARSCLRHSVTSP